MSLVITLDKVILNHNNILFRLGLTVLCEKNYKTVSRVVSR